MKNISAYNQLTSYNQQAPEQQDLVLVKVLHTKPFNSQKLLKIKIDNTSNLRIQDQPRTEIIKQICHIEFPKLTYLNFRNSQIANIESIRYLQCPMLMTLQLYGNRITNMSQLVKNNSMRSLRTITFYGNPLKSKWQVQRQYMPQHTHNGITIQDLSFIVKSSGKRVNKLYANNKNRIAQAKVRNALGRYSNRQDVTL